MEHTHTPEGNADYSKPEPAPKEPLADPEALLKQSRDLDDAHHAESTLHLSDESVTRAGIRQPAFRPETDEKTGAHTGKFVATPAPEVHG